MFEKVYIYGLFDPRDNELRYIGKTNDLRRRLWSHISSAKKGQKTYKADWIRQLLSLGLKPTIGILEVTTEAGWQKVERKHIAIAIEFGAKLTNLTEGGEGLVGYKVSEENKKRLSEYNKKIGRMLPNWKGRKQSPEHIAKRVAARKRNNTAKHSQETKDLISKKNKGKNLGNTHTLGYKHTEEWKVTASERMKGKGNAFYGKKHSKETKEKMSKNRKGKNLGNQNAKKDKKL